MKPKKQFINGAYLFTFDKELTEAEFIEKAGGLDKLESFRQFPFVSIRYHGVGEDRAIAIAGHSNGKVIAACMGDQKYQVMEWRR